MIISDVKTVNLDIIYNIYKVMQEEVNAKFPQNIRSVLERVCITVTIDEMTPWNIQGLKSISSSCTVVKELAIDFGRIRTLSKDIGFKDINNKDFIELCRDLTNIAVYPELARKEDAARISYQHCTNIALPSGCRRATVVATFKGMTILDLFNMNFSNIFKIRNEKDSFEENVENNIIGAILESIFRMEEYQFLIHDALTEVWTESNSYKYVKSSSTKYQPIRVFNETQNVNFIDTDPKKLAIELRCLDSNQNYIELAARLTLQDYFTLMMYPGKDEVIIMDHESYINLLTPNVEISDSLSSEIQEKSELLYSFFMMPDESSRLKFKDSLIAKECLIPGNRMISCSLLVPISIGDDIVSISKFFNLHSLYFSLESYGEFAPMHLLKANDFLAKLDNLVNFIVKSINS